MDFLVQHQEALLTFIGTVAIAFLPPINRILDKLTSSAITQDLFWLIDRIEDGTLTKEEAEQILVKLKKYL